MGVTSNFKSATPPECVNLNGYKITDRHIIVEEFNEFLSNIRKNLAKSFDSTDNETYRQCLCDVEVIEFIPQSNTPAKV